MTVECVSLKKKKKDNLLTELDWIRLRHFGFIYGIHLWKKKSLKWNYITDLYTYMKNIPNLKIHISNSI